ncbi:DUF397 domain-containing protein [Streptomyces hainanensis]|uniref:DUF397 domain-containing protein n=2 Tax=Streptomyces hainanensis TaxID=402648 RepID=A0A4V2Y394_9ACTN|nr:DUF397 domain-containing protein [Streptomyces hainanensis]
MSGIQWQRSSYSTDGGGNACLEVARARDASCLLRESDEPDVIATAGAVRLGALLRAIKRGGLARRIG